MKEHFDFKGLRRPPDLQRRILVVCPEIEAWYLAGVVSNNSLGVPIYSSTDSLTYEEFKRLCQRLGRGEEEVYRQILNEYDWNLAKTRNRSLHYFATRLRL
ncbi:MAG: hypothetical protein N2554_10605 [Fimbriimonadales bacterium]|nr:hypothetical protein [Fimbriimonadales bacterium]